MFFWSVHKCVARITILSNSALGLEVVWYEWLKIYFLNLNISMRCIVVITCAWISCTVLLIHIYKAVRNNISVFFIPQSKNCSYFSMYFQMTNSSTFKLLYENTSLSLEQKLLLWCHVWFTSLAKFATLTNESTNNVKHLIKCMI